MACFVYTSVIHRLRGRRRGSRGYMAGTIICVVAGIVGVVVAAVLWSKTLRKEVHGRFGVIFDAGGSGTRMIIYEYMSTGDLRQSSYKTCESKGLSNYGSNAEQLVPLLKSCLDEAVNHIPDDVMRLTPLYLEATAGMRLLRMLNVSTYATILNAVKHVLQNGSFPVKLVDTITGNQEALYAWTTINMLLGQKESKGLTELGSSSFQIAFEPERPDELRPDSSATIKLETGSYNIYVHSYLCLGREEFGRRFYAKLIKDSNYSSVVRDPCTLQGSVQVLSADYVWKGPCIQGEFADDVLGESFEDRSRSQSYTVEGFGDYIKCSEKIKSMFNQSCSLSSCGINGFYQPHSFGLYLAIGSAAFYPAQFLNVTENSTLEFIENRTQEFCSTRLEKVKAMTGYSKYTDGYCLSNSYTIFLMRYVLKLPADLKSITFANKINGKDPSWTYGSMYAKRDDMSPSLVNTTRWLRKPIFVAILSLSGLIIAASLIITIAGVMKSHVSSTMPNPAVSLT